MSDRTRDAHVVSYTADELDEMLARGEDLTDWDRVRSLTEEEIEGAIDPDDEGEFDRDTGAISGGPVDKQAGE